MSKSKNGEKGKVTTGVVTALAVCALLCGTYALLVKYEKLPESSADIIISREHSDQRRVRKHNSNVQARWGRGQRAYRRLHFCRDPVRRAACRILR